MWVGQGNTGLIFNDGSDVIHVANASGGDRNGVCDLGNTGSRFKDIHLAGNVNASGIRVMEGTSLAGGMFKEKAVTGTGSSNDLSFFAEGISNGGDIHFMTGGSATKKVSINSSGTVLVASNGATPSSSQAGISLGLSGPNGGKISIANTLTSTFAGAMVFVNGNGQVGSIATSGSATSYVTSSDQRLKENIADADDSGTKVDAIQVRKFDWKADGSHQDYGMVAQELQAVAPEAVSVPEDSEEMMGVDYSKLVPMLIKEIQSLRQRVASLEE